MERIVEIEKFSSDESYENILRPKVFDDYVGQDKIKNNLKIFIEAAKKRGECLDHALFFGPAGLGKTTLANIIANEMGVNIKTTAAPMIEKSGDLAAILTNLEPNDILFIDEIHRLSPAIEEVLYPAMEDFRLDIIIGSGAGAQTVKVDINPFTLVGATTKSGSLSSPLRDRFGMHFRLDFYSHDELAKIIKAASKKLGKPCDDDASLLIASRCRQTPRLAIRLLKRVRDFAEVYNEKTINKQRANEALNALGVDERGLDEFDIKYLKLLATSKKPLGLNTIAAAISEDEQTIEDVIEPYLLANNYVERTARGRIATSKTLEVLGINISSLFN